MSTQRDWKPGDRAYIEVEVSSVLDGTAYVWADQDARQSAAVPADRLRPVPAAGEDATANKTTERNHQ